jgi:hypothetical protein
MRISKDPLAPMKAWVELFGVTPVRKKEVRRQWEISIVTPALPEVQPILVANEAVPLPKQ